MLASYWGHAKVVEALIEKGAKVDEKDNNGYQASDFAESAKHAEVVKVLSKARVKQ
jgi:ankyrin repeat protein